MFRLVVLLWLFSSPVWSASINISGSLKGPNGAPLPGCQVSIDGSKISAKSDAKGVFTLKGRITSSKTSIMPSSKFSKLTKKKLVVTPLSAGLPVVVSSFDAAGQMINERFY